MTKFEFLKELEAGLSGLPRKDIEERLAFYKEMIEDQMEEGLSEEEAVSAVGSVGEIVAQIVEETPLLKIAKERIKPRRRLSTGEIVLLAVGSPIWLSLGIAVFAVVFSLYVSLWAVVISLWAVFSSVLGTGIGVIACGILYICQGNLYAGIALIGAGIVCIGLSVFIFFGCKAATKGTVLLTKKTVSGIKKRFIKKEVAQ